MAKQHDTRFLFFYPTTLEARNAAIDTLSGMYTELTKIGGQYLFDEELEIQKNIRRIDARSCLRTESHDTYRKLALGANEFKRINVDGIEPIVAYAGQLETDCNLVPFQLDVLPVMANTFLYLSGSRHTFQDMVKNADAVFTDYTPAENYMVLRDTLVIIENAKFQNHSDTEAVVVGNGNYEELQFKIEGGLGAIDPRPPAYSLVCEEDFEKALTKAIAKSVDVSSSPRFVQAVPVSSRYRN